MKIHPNQVLFYLLSLDLNQCNRISFFFYVSNKNKYPVCNKPPNI